MKSNYYKLYDGLKTGDLIFFSGTNIFSKIIIYLTGCTFSHVGMVVEVDIHDKRVLMLFESNADSNIINFDTGMMRSGVNVVSLTTKLNSYKGSFSLKRLSKPLTYEHKSNIKQVIHEMKDKPYEKNLYVLMSSVFKIKNDEKVNSMFCSRLVAVILQRIGLMSSRKQPNWYTPCELAKIRIMKQNYHYSEVERINLIPCDKDIKII